MGFSVIKDSWSSQDVDIITIFVFGYLLRSGPLPPSLKNFNVVRQSRYAIWIKQYGLRKAQYLAGFKHPSSIQIYQDQDLQDLKEVILRWHPLDLK